MKNLPPDAIVTGEWDGEPIWHHQTAEERLLAGGVKRETLELALLLLGHKDGMKILNSLKP